MLQILYHQIVVIVVVIIAVVVVVVVIIIVVSFLKEFLYVLMKDKKSLINWHIHHVTFVLSWYYNGDYNWKILWLTLPLWLWLFPYY